MSQPARQPSATADRSWMTWAALGLGAIWAAVLAISVASPDLVSGSQHEHLPIALFATWIWGLAGTIAFLWGMSKLRGSASRRSLWAGLAITVMVVWVIATIVSVVSPVMVTGSDPTELPLVALGAPIGAALVTTLASVVAGVFSQAPGESGPLRA
ncbi:MAG TPA: hypothetical protein VI277_01000 [Candidatus Limnocylindria bacterium]